MKEQIGNYFKPYGVIQNVKSNQKKVFLSRTELIDFIKHENVECDEKDFMKLSKRGLVTKYLPLWVICQ